MKLRLPFLLLIVSLIFVGCTSKKTGEAAIVSDASKASATGYPKMIVATLSVKPEKIKDFTEAAKEIIEKSNKEAGCQFYQLFQDPYDNSKFIFVERYTGQDAVETHFASDYFKAFGPKIGDFVAQAANISILSIAEEVKK